MMIWIFYPTNERNLKVVILLLVVQLVVSSTDQNLIGEQVIVRFMVVRMIQESLIKGEGDNGIVT